MSIKSISSLELAHKLAPDNQKILLYLAIAYELKQNYVKAIEVYEKLVILDPSSKACLEKIVQLVKQSKRASARARFELVRAFCCGGRKLVRTSVGASISNNVDIVSNSKPRLYLAVNNDETMDFTKA